MRSSVAASSLTQAAPASRRSRPPPWRGRARGARRASRAGPRRTSRAGPPRRSRSGGAGAEGSVRASSSFRRSASAGSAWVVAGAGGGVAARLRRARYRAAAAIPTSPATHPKSLRTRPSYPASLLPFRGFLPRRAPPFPGCAHHPAGPTQTEGRRKGTRDRLRDAAAARSRARRGAPDAIVGASARSSRRAAARSTATTRGGGASSPTRSTKKEDGIYHLLTFSADPETLDEVSRVLKIDDDVLRHLATRRVESGSTGTMAPRPGDGRR